MLCAGSGETEAAAGESDVAQVADDIGGGKLPDLGRAGAGEIGKVERDEGGPGQIFADDHGGQRAICGTLGGKGGDIVRVGNGGRHAGIAEGGLACRRSSDIS